MGDEGSDGWRVMIFESFLLRIFIGRCKSTKRKFSISSVDNLRCLYNN